MDINELNKEISECNKCKLRKNCSRVLVGQGSLSPKLLIIGEMPTDAEDSSGDVFVGQAGKIVREVLRYTGIIKKHNSYITYLLKCKTDGQKFPNGECPKICMASWLCKEIDLLKPKRMLLLGSMPLKYLAGIEGITNNRGRWLNIRNVRTMATWNPTFIVRKDSEGDISYRNSFERDINEVAKEIKYLEEDENGEDSKNG